MSGDRICTWEVLVYNWLSSSKSTRNGTFYFCSEFDLTDGDSICLLGKMGLITQHNCVNVAAFAVGLHNKFVVVFNDKDSNSTPIRHDENSS